MRRALVAAATLTCVTASALAQPGLTPPGGAPPAAPVPGYAPVAPVLSDEDRDILERGEVGDLAHAAGAVTNVFFGFGVGQALQGRWSTSGWRFTLGGGASFLLLYAGFIGAWTCDSESECDSAGTMGLLGLLGFGVFHVWGIYDAFQGPVEHNRRYHQLRAGTSYGPQWGLYLDRARHGDGGVAGLSLTF